MTKRSLQLMIFASILAMTTGCGDIRSGSAIASEIDVRTLNTGQYVTEPTYSYREYSHTFRSGSNLAEIRLMNHMITGLDVDQKLKYATGVQSLDGAIEDDAEFVIDDLSQVLSKASAEVAVDNNLLYGFASGSSDHRPDAGGESPPSETLLTISVMQFSSGNIARRAAAEMEQADFDVASEKNKEVDIDKYQRAHSHWQPGTPNMGSMIARGHYVVSLFVQVPNGDLSDLTKLAAKAYDKQLPLLDSLDPLTPEQVVKLEPASDSLTPIVLNPSPEGTYSVTNGRYATYEERGFLHFQADRQVAKELYESTHIDRFAVSGAYITDARDYNETGNARAFGKGILNTTDGIILYRSADKENAQKAWEELLPEPDPTMNLELLPNAKCKRVPDLWDYYRQFSCAVRYHNFVAITWSPQLLGAQQRAAAEYALLANSQWM